MNVIKMIAYKAEIALLSLLKPKFKIAEKERRQIIKSTLAVDAEILFNHEAETLTVKRYEQAIHTINELLKLLCKQRNETKTVYPQTDLTTIF